MRPAIRTRAVVIGILAVSTPHSAAAQQIAGSVAAWVQQHGVPLRGEPAFEAIADDISSRRVVQLGESAHGVREFSRIKVDLIRYLHENRGFDVVAFESSLFDCWAPQSTRAIEASDYMRRCAFGVWWTEDVRELFEYALSTIGSDRPLRIVGFDVQFTPTAHRALLGLLRDWLEPHDAALANRIYAADSAFVVDFAPKNWTTFDSVASILDEEASAIANANFRSQADVRLLAMSLRSVAAFQRIRRADTVKAQVWERDRGMARNLRDLVDLYPESRFVVWGHNFHLRERNSAVEPFLNATMGEWLSFELGPDLYTIGFYMGEGTATHNDRSVYIISPPDGELLERQLADGAGEAFFVPIHGPSATWAQGPWSIRTGGRTINRMVPVDQYDALIFVPTVTPPAYVDVR